MAAILHTAVKLLWMFPDSVQSLKTILFQLLFNKPIRSGLIGA